MTDKTMVQVPGDSPVMLAWNEYKRGPDYANIKNWATKPEHTDGSLWAAFLAGFNARAAVGASDLLPVLDLLRTDRNGKKWDYVQSHSGSMVNVSQFFTPPAPKAEAVECVLAESRERAYMDKLGREDHARRCQPESGGQGEGMLHNALVPHATEWYRLCERRFSADRITISGELAEAIVKALDTHPPAQTSAAVTDAMVDKAIGFAADARLADWLAFGGTVTEQEALAALSQGGKP